MTYFTPFLMLSHGKRACYALFLRMSNKQHNDMEVRD